MITELKGNNEISEFSAISASSAVQNILVIQLTKMGDLLQTTPLLQRIKDRYPEASMSLLVDEKNMELAEGIPTLSEVIPIDLSGLTKKMEHPDWKLSRKYKELSQSLRGLTERSFDLVYNINFSRISARLAELFGKARVIGYEIGSDGALTSKEPWVHFVFHLMANRKLLRLNLVDLLAGYEKRIRPKPHPLIYSGNFREKGSMDPSNRPGKIPVIGLQLGCGGELRRWPVEHFASLAIRLVEELKARVLLFGSQNEVDLGLRFAQAWEEKTFEKPDPNRFCNLIGKTTIPELAARLKKIDLLVTADTGTMHLASAMGTKTLGLFMATASCHETGPYGDGHFVVQTDLPCHPCQGEGPSCPKPLCRQMIRPAMIFEVIKKIFSHRDFSKDDEKRSFQEMASLWDPRVQLYRSFMDEWGVKFLPLLPRQATLLDLMAGIYREVCRELMDESYPASSSPLMREFSAYYEGFAKETAPEAIKIKEYIHNCLEGKNNPYFCPGDIHPFLKPVIGFISHPFSQVEKILQPVHRILDGWIRELGWES
jgi:ADP-heptose:LPS heptosyltransferase